MSQMDGGRSVNTICTMTNSIRLLLISVVGHHLLRYSTTDGKEYCHNEQFTAKCPDDELILVTSALYGRMRIGNCVKTDFGYIGCSYDVTKHLHERCSGRPSCSLRIPDATLDRTKPCNEDLKSYLDANYTCIKVSIPPSLESCDLQADSDNFSGYLSSRFPFASSKPCGSNESPWSIRVKPGQRVNISLFDFSSALSSQKGTPVPTVACEQYAVLQEPDSIATTPVCGPGQVQKSHVYTSTGNVLRVIVRPRKVNSTHNYLFRYDAVGCPDFETPPNAWINRNEGGELTVGCPESDEIWQFVCEGNRWEGSAGNCSAVILKDPVREDGFSPLSLGASILTILGVSMTIGIVVLLIGLFYMRSKRIGNVIGQELAMRDLKPLSSEAAVYDTTVVYARNKAFEPVKVNIVRSSATESKPGQEQLAANAASGEYEYVWDSPSNTAALSGRAGHPMPGNRMAPKPRMMAEDSPDLLKATTSAVAPSSPSPSSFSTPSCPPRGGSSGQTPPPRSVTLPKKEMGRRFERQTGTLSRMGRGEGQTLAKPAPPPPPQSLGSTPEATDARGQCLGSGTTNGREKGSGGAVDGSTSLRSYLLPKNNPPPSIPQSGAKQGVNVPLTTTRHIKG